MRSCFKSDCLVKSFCFHILTPDYFVTLVNAATISDCYNIVSIIPMFRMLIRTFHRRYIPHWWDYTLSHLLFPHIFGKPFHTRFLSFFYFFHYSFILPLCLNWDYFSETKNNVYKYSKFYSYLSFNHQNLIRYIIVESSLLPYHVILALPVFYPTFLLCMISTVSYFHLSIYHLSHESHLIIIKKQIKND